MVVYLAGSNTTWLWAVRANSAQMYKLDITADELAREVAFLRGFLDPDANPSLKPFPARRAHRLYQRILAPAEPIIRGAHNLIIVPDGALDSLPLSVLVSEAPARDPVNAADHRNVHWLAADYATSVLPSIASLHALRTFARPSRASSPFFGVGNPSLGGSQQAPREQTRGAVSGVGPVLADRLPTERPRSFREPGALAQALQALPSLPETATELQAIARIEGASKDDLLLGNRATEPELGASSLDRYRIIELPPMV